MLQLSGGEKMANNQIYTLKNEFLKINITPIGAAIVDLIVTVNNTPIDVVLKHNKLSDYLTNDGNLGAIVGPNANRIENAMININHQEYSLEANEGKHNLHSGQSGFQFKIFDVVEQNDNHIILSTLHPHLEGGFPGNLYTEVIYTIQDKTLLIEYKAKSDHDTIVNLTNHSYFNLNANHQKTIDNHELMINSEFYAPNRPDGIPTGELLSVTKTPFDFQRSTLIGPQLKQDHSQLKQHNGFDHSYMLNGQYFRNVAELSNQESKLKMIVATDCPTMHVYTSNHFNEQSKYPLHGGICFETQMIPNAFNTPWHIQPLLKANETYHSKTSFSFTKLK